MKKVNIISGLLLVYLIVMSVFGWQNLQKEAEPDYTQYFLVIGVTLGIIILLRFLQIRRHKMREKIKKGEE